MLNAVPTSGVLDDIIEEKGSDFSSDSSNGLSRSGRVMGLMYFRCRRR
jgi:hypothetical protein